MKFVKFLAVVFTVMLFAGAATAQTTLGAGTSAQSGVAIGTRATSGDTAAGIFSPTQPVYTGAIAIGNGANASGKNIAIGDGISAPQDGVAGMYTFAIGGLNSNNGLIEMRRLVGMANGIFTNDGANMGQLWQARDLAISTSNSYTNTSLSNALMPVDFRLGNVEALGANNATRLDRHDVILDDHDQRITSAQTTADTALTTASVADSKATVALSQSSQALSISQETQREVSVLNGRMDTLEAKVDGMKKDMNAIGAMSMAATSSVNSGNLGLGETGIGMAVGAFRSQAAIAGSIKHVNYAGQTFSATISSSRAGTGVGVGAFIKF
jgi:hypothetical protein